LIGPPPIFLEYGEGGRWGTSATNLDMLPYPKIEDALLCFPFWAPLLTKVNIGLSNIEFFH